MKTNFLGPAYQSRSPILGSQTAINIYPELMETKSDEVGGYYGTPGLTSKFTGSGEVRGLREAGGVLWAVIGSTVWRIGTNWVGTSLGTLPNNTGRVSITDNGTQIAIAHQDGWHWVAYGGTAIAAVSGAPTGSILDYQDGYGIFTRSSGGTFGITTLSDLSTIDPLDIATAEGASDDLISLICDHREVWLFGTRTTEVWNNTGAALFPFERAPGGFIEQGCVAARSPAKIDNSVFWLGKDSAGKGIVYRTAGYIPARISTHAIEYAINQYSDITDAIGYCYQEEGHSFYVLTFPTGDETWVYDVASKMWHQRAYLDSFGVLHRHRSNCFAHFNNQLIVGDYSNGKIYKMSLDVGTDDGDEIYRERAWELPNAENKRIRIDRLELIALTGDGDGSGSAPQVWLQISKDAGRTWDFQRFKTMGNIGQTRARCLWRPRTLGRDVVCRIGTTMSQRVSWIGVNGLGEAYSQ